MSENTILLDPQLERHLEEKKYLEKSSSASAPSQAGEPFQGVDAVVLAFYFLMEAADASAQSAIVHAKQLKQNAVAQQQLNDDDAQMKWHYVPTLQVNHHTIRNTHDHWQSVDGVPVESVTFTYVRWTTEPNADIVNNAQTKNREVIAQRQTIADRLNILQQSAQIGETNINTSTDDSMQAMQESQNLLQILQSLTFKALMRQPPA